MLNGADGLYLTDYTDCRTGFCELLLSPYRCHTGLKKCLVQFDCDVHASLVVSTRCSVQMIRAAAEKG